MYEEIRKIQEKTIGIEHPSYADTLNNIAVVLNKQGKYEESLEIYEECRKIQEKNNWN